MTDIIEALQFCTTATHRNTSRGRANMGANFVRGAKIRSKLCLQISIRKVIMYHFKHIVSFYNMFHN